MGDALTSIIFSSHIAPGRNSMSPIELRATIDCAAGSISATIAEVCSPAQTSLGPSSRPIGPGMGSLLIAQSNHEEHEVFALFVINITKKSRM
jgi:hypothetical protein